MGRRSWKDWEGFGISGNDWDEVGNDWEKEKWKKMGTYRPRVPDLGVNYSMSSLAG